MQYLRNPKTLIGTSVAALAFLGIVGYSMRKQEQPIQGDFSLLSNSISLEYRNKPPGLVNSGNHCFVNSVLQALASQPSFVEYLFELVYHFRDETNIHQQICVELASLMKLLNGGNSNNVTAINLIILLQNDQNYSYFEQQQDCHELFNALMSHIENAQQSIQIQDLGSFNKKYCTLVNPFLNYTQIQIKCTQCIRNYYIKMETNYALHLEIYNSDDIESAIAEFQKPETISGYICIYCSLAQILKQLNDQQSKDIVNTYMVQTYFECDPEDVISDVVAKIKLHNPAIMLNSKQLTARRVVEKQTKIAKYPQVLCFYLKRLTVIRGELVKLSKCILTPPIIRNCYNLTAVICHLGNAAYGHFVTLKRTFAMHIDSLSEQNKYEYGEWYLTSDTQVIQYSSPYESYNVEAYLVFYDSSK